MTKIKLGLAFFIIPGVAFSASDISNNDRQKVIDNNRQTEQRQYQLDQERQRSLDASRSKAPGGVKSKKNAINALKDKHCFNIREIDIDGVTVFSDEEVSIITAPYLNSCIGLGKIDNLLKTITNLYIDNGYIASRAYVPEQDISKGKLRLFVSEGKLEGYTVNEEKAGSKPEVFAAFPLTKGRPVQLRDVEQGLEQMNRLPSNDVTMALSPGQNPGGTIIAIKNNKSKPYRFNLGIDNLGSDSTGRYRGKIGFEVDNLFSLNDMLSFSYEKALTRYSFDFSDSKKKSYSVSGAFSVPFGYWTFFIDGSYFKYANMIKLTYSDAETAGRSKSLRMGVSRVLHRNQVSKTVADISLILKSTKNFIRDAVIELGSRKLTVAKMQLVHSRRLLSGAWNFTFAYERGLDWFGAIEDGKDNKADAKAQFNKFTSTFSVTYPFTIKKQNFFYSGLLSGQYSDGLLFGSEQMSLGGLYSVRGVKDSPFYGNNGIFSRNEISWALPQAGNSFMDKFGHFRPFVAMDFGYIDRQKKYGIQGGNVGGWTAGLKTVGGDISLLAAYSDILFSSQNLSQDYGVFYGQASVSF